MTTSTRDIILSLIGYGSERQPQFGRTSLQKVAYFAALKTGTDLGHRAFYYGPYSATVEDETEALVLSGLVDQGVTNLGFVNKEGFPGVRYSYSLNEAGNERLAAVEKRSPDLATKLKSTVEDLDETIGSLDQGLLSLAAKTYFIADEQGKEVSVSQIQELAKQKNWHITQGQVKKVAKLLKKLGLVNLSTS